MINPPIAVRLLLYGYSIIITLLAPLLVLRLLLRSIKLPAYRERVSERFAVFKYASNRKSIWVHAVSLGEATAAMPIINLLQQQEPDTPIFMTCTTPTGSAYVSKHLKHHSYNPYDIPWVIAKFIKKVKPKMLIILEKELWPNMIYGCAQANIPIILANATLSCRSLRRYLLLRSFARNMLSQVSGIAAQSQADGKKFIALGADSNKVTVAGNTKFSLDNKIDLIAVAEIKEIFGANRPVLIAASTHKGEEEIIITAFGKVIQVMPEVLLVLVPRHPNRFVEVAKLISAHDCSFVKRSDNVACASDTQIFLADSMGELNLLYAASDLAFVGGSLLDNIGGHNLLEPGAVGLPIITGCYLHNCVEISEMLLNNNALEIVHHIKQLPDKIIKLLQNRDLANNMGRNAKQVVASHKDAASNVVKVILTLSRNH